MENKIYHLSSCSTNKKILSQLKNLDKVRLINIKESNINSSDLDYAALQLGTYEAVFSRKAQKYRALGLHEKTLSENEMRQLILEEYTFLKRPVSFIEGKVFAGNTKESVEGLFEAMNKLG
ncbi:MAG TPA: ArsC/Spx/MgsR family protein [Saprospiraceae bacterium]|nr:ArsC/Spx/MgsR family protein [Saprospiraceae bacterium]